MLIEYHIFGSEQQVVLFFAVTNNTDDANVHKIGRHVRRHSLFSTPFLQSGYYTHQNTDTATYKYIALYTHQCHVTNESKTMTKVIITCDTELLNRTRNVLLFCLFSLLFNLIQIYRLDSFMIQDYFLKRAISCTIDLLPPSHKWPQCETV